MRDTKFTKGDWVAETCGSRVSVWSDNESIIEPMTFRYPNAEDEQRVMANAHLIASAPDMYKLLQRFLPMDEDGNGWDFQYDEGSEEMGEDVIKLLAKARGE